ncbi:hypothetical protein [Micromonospora sp. NPDC048169]|uniref:hypothetical protein n=1 Tax=Micromonospora sp. NPDC048169 TaxID=3154711 RepID=UPI0034066F5D
MSGKSPTNSGVGAGRRQEPHPPSSTQTSSAATSFTNGSGSEILSEIEPEGLSGHALSRYYAKFAAAPGQDPFSERRIIRARLLHTLRQVSTVDRCKSCGWTPLGLAVVLKVGTTGDRKTAGFGGLERCGRIWLCPECAAKIRLRRGEEVAEGISRHLDNDGGALFWTVAIPHEQGDALKAVFTTLTELIRLVASGRPFQRDKKALGILGNIKAIEVTHGRNGWHPHAHILVVTERVLTWEQWTTFARNLDYRVAAALKKLGWNTGRAGIRSTVIPVDKGEGLAAYITKVQEKGLGNELARADLKSGRRGGRTPFEILADFSETGLVDDLELWWEYEKATAGRSAIRWSKGLRALLLPDTAEQSDDEIAAEEQGGEAAAYITMPAWRRIRRDPEVRLACEFAAAEEGWEGLLRVLIRYRISAQGIYTPEEWAVPDEVELEPG